MSRYRHEYKYMINACQDAILQVKASIIPKDSHVNADGRYVVRSLYFDDVYDSCLMDNLAGTDPRSKFRLRYYGDDLSRISLEKKSKIREMNLKESCQITLEEAKTFLSGSVPELKDGDDAVKVKLFTEVRTRGLYPKVIVTYERTPFVYPGGNVRVTFDGKITSSYEVDKFLDGDYITRPVLPLGNSILEVKWDEVMPRHIKDTLQLENLTWTAFSKYFMCRMIHL